MIQWIHKNLVFSFELLLVSFFTCLFLCCVSYVYHLFVSSHCLCFIAYCLHLFADGKLFLVFFYLSVMAMILALLFGFQNCRVFVFFCNLHSFLFSNIFLHSMHFQHFQFLICNVNTFDVMYILFCYAL